VAGNDKKQVSVSILRQFLNKRAKTKDFYLSIFLLAFSLVLIFWLIPFHVETMEGPQVSVKANFFPYSVTFLLAFLSILLLYYCPQTSHHSTRADDKRVTFITIGCIAILFVTFYGIRIIGMVPMSILSLFVLMRIFGFQKWYWALPFSIAFVLLIFLFFEKIAQVTIPRGVLFEGWF
jgi:cytochrome c biogenesis factor